MLDLVIGLLFYRKNLIWTKKDTKILLFVHLGFYTVACTTIDQGGLKSVECRGFYKVLGVYQVVLNLCQGGVEVSRVRTPGRVYPPPPHKFVRR